MSKQQFSKTRAICKTGLKVQLIPTYISESEFKEKLVDVQTLLVKMFTESEKKGRKNNIEDEEDNCAA